MLPLYVRVPWVGGSTQCVEAPLNATAGELLALLAPHAPHGRRSSQFSLRHQGRPLPADAVLHRTVRPDDTLQVSLRLLGGGGDGGATGAESRSSYLEMYKEQAVGKLDAREELLAVWTLCRLTRAPLGGADGRQQVVLCPLGCMYDREAVLTALKERSLDGIPLPPLVAHIKSLKSLTTLQLHLSDPPATDTAAAAAAAADFREPRAEHVRFSCPLTGLQMNGRYRFVALCPSGVVVSERALKSAPAAVEDMLAGATLASQQQIPIYGTPEEVDALRVALAAKAAAASNGKGKRKAEAAPADAPAPPPPPPAPQAVRKAGVAPAAPAGATKEVWNSLFTSSGPAAKVETFGARNVSARR